MKIFAEFDQIDKIHSYCLFELGRSFFLSGSNHSFSWESSSSNNQYFSLVLLFIIRLTSVRIDLWSNFNHFSKKKWWSMLGDCHDDEIDWFYGKIIVCFEHLFLFLLTPFFCHHLWRKFEYSSPCRDSFWLAAEFSVMIAFYLH